MSSPVTENGLWNLRDAYRARNESRYPGGQYNIELLLVGGGGQGGGWFGGGGGGGAGGLIYTNAIAVSAGTCYAITIGSGGASNDGNGISLSHGSSTTFCYTDAGVSLIALCGGGGGPGNGPNPGQTPGTGVQNTTVNHDATVAGATLFGSGGGGGIGGGTTPLSPGNDGTIGPRCGVPGCQGNPACAPVLMGGLPQFTGYGNSGGFACVPTGGVPTCGGGGGGAGGAGCPGATPPGCPSFPAPCGGGRGGLGLCFSISGTQLGYAGGGGGSVFGDAYAKAFGASPGLQNNGAGVCITTIANRGGGSGSVPGGICCSHAAPGVAIIRYSGTQRGCGGSISTSLSPTIETSHVFTGSGSFEA